MLLDRESFGYYNPMIKLAVRREISLILIIAIMIVVVVTPQSAASSGLYSSSFTERGEGLIKKAVELIEADSLREAEEALLLISSDDSEVKYEAHFLLGRLYSLEGAYGKSEDHLKDIIDNYPVLRDYALKLLMDIYSLGKEYGKVTAVSGLISSRLLQKDARKAEIEALLNLGKHDQAAVALAQYVGRYHDEWEYKLKLAGLHEERGAKDLAIGIYKGVYVEDVPLSGNALKRLKDLGANDFTKKELLKRSGNLFSHHRYGAAEASYRSLLGSFSGKTNKKLQYKLGMSQFRQKKYKKSAVSFAKLKTPKAMYWSARSYYRIDDEEGFNKTKKELGRNYPDSKHLALLYLMEAEEFRRNGKTEEAEKGYTQVLSRFPDSAEDALWGLGWMYYMSGNYRGALDSFSQLTRYSDSREYYKYLYWNAIAGEKLYSQCVLEKPESGAAICNKKERDFFSGLASNGSYYGHLITERSESNGPPEKITMERPTRPEGILYDRIESLILMGMKDEAVIELTDSYKQRKTERDYRYLSYLAMDLEEYKRVIAFAEPRSERELLPYSYPRAYWDSISMAAEREGLDAYLIAALIREESRFDRKAASWAGAIGLMQLIPSTANRMGRTASISLQGSHELQDSEKNILLGSHYLARLIKEFTQVPLAIAAYNAGERRLEDWMARFSNEDIVEFIENIPYKETRRYVKKVLKSYWQYRSINGLPAAGMRDGLDEETIMQEIPPIPAPV